MAQLAEKRLLATSPGGQPIELFQFGKGSCPVLLLGGVHGDESEGFLLCERLLTEIAAGSFALPSEITLWVVPRVNPDGCANLRRTNHHNVDLNRNMPTKDWSGAFTNVRYYPGPAAGSEPETVIVTKLIDEFIEPRGNGLIISMHSYEHAMINFNGECEDLAQAMSAHNQLPPKGDIGYPTPGSLGTYAGWERNIPTITLEIHRGDEPEPVWLGQKDALGAAFSFYTRNKLPQRKQA